MKKNGFQFKQFFVAHDRCAMKVGTDSILLGSWCQVTQAKRILDIGTGSGLLALMMAQRAVPEAQIDAVDIDEGAAVQSQLNVANSPWSDKISLYHRSITHFEANEPYDLIVTNPPYFEGKKGDLVRSDPQYINEQRRLARHSIGLSFPMLIDVLDRLLSANGQCNLVLPDTAAKEFIRLASQYHLHPLRQLFVATRNMRQPSRRLICLGRGKRQSIEEHIVIHDDYGQYSPQFKSLCKDFYLNF